MRTEIAKNQKFSKSANYFPNVLKQKFEEKYLLPFDLISDEDKAIHKSYGTWVEKSMYGRKYMGTARWTFIINENGIINNIIEKVKTKEHTNQILGE